MRYLFVQYFAILTVVWYLFVRYVTIFAVVRYLIFQYVTIFTVMRYLIFQYVTIFAVVWYLYCSSLRDYFGCATELMFITVWIYRTTVKSEKIPEDQVPHNRKYYADPEIRCTTQPQKLRWWKLKSFIMAVLLQCLLKIKWGCNGLAGMNEFYATIRGVWTILDHFKAKKPFIPPLPLQRMPMLKGKIIHNGSFAAWPSDSEG